VGSAAGLLKIVVRGVITHLFSLPSLGNCLCFQAGFLLGHKIAAEISGVLSRQKFLEK
jgi:hypothetical protein